MIETQPNDKIPATGHSTLDTLIQAAGGTGPGADVQRPAAVRAPRVSRPIAEFPYDYEVDCVAAYGGEEEPQAVISAEYRYLDVYYTHPRMRTFSAYLMGHGYEVSLGCRQIDGDTEGEEPPRDETSGRLRVVSLAPPYRMDIALPPEVADDADALYIVLALARLATRDLPSFPLYDDPADLDRFLPILRTIWDDDPVMSPAESAPELPEDVRSYEQASASPVRQAVAKLWSYYDLDDAHRVLAGANLDVAAQNAAVGHHPQAVADILRLQQREGASFALDSPDYPRAASLLIHALAGLAEDCLATRQANINNGAGELEWSAELPLKAAKYYLALARVVAGSPA